MFVITKRICFFKNNFRTRFREFASHRAPLLALSALLLLCLPSTGEESAQIPEGTQSSAAEPKSEPAAPNSAEKATQAGGQSSIRPGQPIKLYGRIEELCQIKGAKIPLKMQAMTPIRDSSLDGRGSAAALSGKAATMRARTEIAQVFPDDYRGSWSGQITINSANYDPAYFLFDAQEAKKEAEMLKPGTKGNYTVNFYLGSNNKIQMQPSQVMFTGVDTMGNQLKVLEKSNPGMKSMLGAAANPMMANMQMPVYFALHMGTPITNGDPGLTGNKLTSELMKSELKELKKGVLESQIVTKEHTYNPESHKSQDGFSESVLRFTRLNSRQLYLQAAYVYYRHDGHFLAKYIFYGTLDRSTGQAAAPAQMVIPFGSGGTSPFGQMPGGQAGSLQEQMNQMQNMLKKMSGQ